MALTEDLAHWNGRPRPERRTLDGQYVRLEPLSVSKHGDALFKASQVVDADMRFRYLGEYPPESREAFTLWLDKAEGSSDPLFFAVVDVQSGLAVGRQSLMRIDAANGVVEVGHIYWGPELARTRGATEAFHLTAAYVFETLGYRRLEWKCNDLNAGSKRAALRFGFSHEGLFRKHMVIKGASRDTAWFAMLDHEWPLIGAANRLWLSAENFDMEGRQNRRLEDFRLARNALKVPQHE